MLGLRLFCFIILEIVENPGNLAPKHYRGLPAYREIGADFKEGIFIGSFRLARIEETGHHLAIAFRRVFGYHSGEQSIAGLRRVVDRVLDGGPLCTGRSRGRGPRSYSSSSLYSSHICS